MRDETPEAMLPGIGLRPGENRPDLERFIVESYRALYAKVAEQSRHGVNVMVDVGHHDVYSKPLGILPDCMRLLSGLPVLLVGVRCALKVILERRAAASDVYVADVALNDTASPVHLWQEAVHVPGIYDLEVETSQYTARECAMQIAERLESGPPFEAAVRLAKL